MREGGGGGALHQRERIISAAQVELRGLACHFVKKMPSDTTHCVPHSAAITTALSAGFTSAPRNRRDVTCTSSAGSVVGCDGAPFLCRYLVEGFSVGAPSHTFK